MFGAIGGTSPTMTRYITTTVSDGRVIIKTEADISEEEIMPAPAMDTAAGVDSFGNGQEGATTIKMEEQPCHENEAEADMATSSRSVEPTPNASANSLELEMMPAMDVTVPDAVMPSMPVSTLTSTGTINNTKGHQHESSQDQNYSRMMIEVDSFLEEIFSLDEYSTPPVSASADTNQEQMEAFSRGNEDVPAPAPASIMEPSEPTSTTATQSSSSAIVREPCPCAPIAITSTSAQTPSPVSSTITAARTPSPIPSTSASAQIQSGMTPCPPQVVDSDAETERATSPIPTPSPKRKPKKTPSSKTISKKPKNKIKKTKGKPNVTSKTQDTSGSKTKPVKKIDLPRVTKDKKNNFFARNPIEALLPRSNVVPALLGRKIPDSVFAKCFNMARKKTRTRRAKRRTE